VITINKEAAVNNEVNNEISQKNIQPETTMIEKENITTKVKEVKVENHQENEKSKEEVKPEFNFKDIILSVRNKFLKDKNQINNKMKG